MTATALEDRPKVDVECCDHCGSTRRTLALDASPWKLVRCEDCDFVYTSPRLSSETLAQMYSDEYYENAESYSSQQVEAPLPDHFELASRSRRMLNASGRKLSSIDVGCGGGRLVEAFASEGFDACGIEPSENTVAVARSAGRNVTTTDVSDVPDAAYDCVTLLHVLEHVDSPAEFAEQLFRITRPGGLCVVEVPNFGSRAAQQLGADWYPLHPSTHLSHFTPQTLGRCLETAGYTVRTRQRLGGAGVFSDVSESAPRRKSEASAATPAPNLRRKTLAAIWSMRSRLTSVPAARRLVRWVNWELLGHGEFVRVTAQRAA